MLSCFLPAPPELPLPQNCLPWWVHRALRAPGRSMAETCAWRRCLERAPGGPLPSSPWVQARHSHLMSPQEGEWACRVGQVATLALMLSHGVAGDSDSGGR